MQKEFSINLMKKKKEQMEVVMNWEQNMMN